MSQLSANHQSMDAQKKIEKSPFSLPRELLSSGWPQPLGEPNILHHLPQTDPASAWQTGEPGPATPLQPGARVGRLLLIFLHRCLKAPLPGLTPLVWYEPALPSLRIYSSGRERDKAGAGGWGELWCLIGALKTKF